jgi:hypothetical protein
MTSRALLLLLAVVLASPSLAQDMIVFVNGDRLSGTIVATGTRRIKLRTPYGRLEIPRTEIERLVWEDGREEVITPPAEPPPPKTTSDLVLFIRGNTFWQAWDPASPPADPSLRLVLRLDDGEVFSWTDVHLDPEDLSKAVVNSFLFDPERLFLAPAEGVSGAPPEPGSRGIQLALELPAELAGEHRLQVAYQVNDGSSSSPEWRDIVEARTHVELSPERPVHVKVEQDRGLMEYREQQMQNVDTFRVIAREVPPSP